MGDENEPRAAAEPEGQRPRVMDRIILETLIARLENEVDTVNEGFFSAWEGDEEKLAACAGVGKLHLAEALLYARQALASGDIEQIRTAVQNCPTLERTGQELARKALEAERRRADEEKLRAAEADARRDVELENAATARKAKEAGDERALNALKPAIKAVCEAQGVSMVDSDAFAESIHADVHKSLVDYVRADPESGSNIEVWRYFGKRENWPGGRTIRRAIQAILEECVNDPGHS